MCAVCVCVCVCVRVRYVGTHTQIKIPQSTDLQSSLLYDTHVDVQIFKQQYKEHLLKIVVA